MNWRVLQTRMHPLARMHVHADPLVLNSLCSEFVGKRRTQPWRSYCGSDSALARCAWRHFQSAFAVRRQWRRMFVVAMAMLLWSVQAVDSSWRVLLIFLLVHGRTDRGAVVSAVIVLYSLRYCSARYGSSIFRRLLLLLMLCAGGVAGKGHGKVKIAVVSGHLLEAGVNQVQLLDQAVAGGVLREFDALGLGLWEPACQLEHGLSLTFGIAKGQNVLDAQGVALMQQLHLHAQYILEGMVLPLHRVVWEQVLKGGAGTRDLHVV